MKKLLLLLSILCCTNALFAQQEQNPKGFRKDKLFAGGNFGLTFGSYTFINLSPQIGYRFSKYLAAGTGLNLMYASLKEKDNLNRDFSKTTSGIVGLKLFSRFYPTPGIVLQIQPEGNYIFGKTAFYQDPKGVFKNDTEIVPSFLTGGGVVVPSGNGEFITTLMYDVLQKPNSPYGKRAIVNVGYNVRLK